jgi:hypothetical protein
MYKLFKLFPSDEIKHVLRLSDNMSIPFDSNNPDYQEYLKWIDGYEHQYDNETRAFQWVKTSNGNTPLPADE